MQAFLFFLFLLPAVSWAAPVPVDAVATALLENIPAIIEVGGACLALYVGIDAFRYVKEVMGVGGSGSAPVQYLLGDEPGAKSYRGYGSQHEYLDSLASHLRKMDEFEGVEWRDEGTGKSNLDYMAEAGRAGTEIDRSQYSSAELSAYDKAESESQFKEKDFAPPLSSAETAALDDFEAGYASMWASQGLRAEAESAGSDMALYDRFISEDATHEEAMRWSNTAANQEIKLPKNY